MIKNATRKITWTLLTIGVGLLLYFAYDLKFKFIINNYQSKQIEKRLIANFKKNKVHFAELLVFCKNIGTLENVTFGKSGHLSFQQYDSLTDRTKSGHLNLIDMGENSSHDIKDIIYSDSNTLLLMTLDTSILYRNWAINFDGKMNSLLAQKILAYNSISKGQLGQLNKLLHRINCTHFYKDENLIVLRYAGHWGESFNYNIALNDTVNKSRMNKLSGDYYWDHYVNELFCGSTDW